MSFNIYYAKFACESLQFHNISDPKKCHANALLVRSRVKFSTFIYFDLLLSQK